MATGRYAPSPTGQLHVGNLRTGLLAWLVARSAGSGFVMRVEDLDPVAASEKVAKQQLLDLAALGIDWDGEVMYQSDRRAVYDEVLATLEKRGLLYPCYCSRREIREAAQAPHETGAPAGIYPGTCRNLSAAEQATREASGRPPALRVRAGDVPLTVHDRLCGEYTGLVDDFVVRRGDGTPGYQLTVVVDDAAQGVEEVVRADDLLASTPRQVWLADQLDLPAPAYAHVPLVLGADGERLAKRHGAVSLIDLRQEGVTTRQVLSLMAESLGLAEPGEPVATAGDLVDRFNPAALPRDPWVFSIPSA